MVWDENGKAHKPTVPTDYKLFKIVSYFNLDRNREYSRGEIDILYDKLQLYKALDSVEFPSNSLF